MLSEIAYCRIYNSLEETIHVLTGVALSANYANVIQWTICFVAFVGSISVETNFDHVIARQVDHTKRGHVTNSLNSRTVNMQMRSFI